MSHIFKPIKKTKKKITLVAKTPSPPKAKAKTPSPPKAKTPKTKKKTKKLVFLPKTPSPPKVKTPSPPKTKVKTPSPSKAKQKTLKKKLKSPTGDKKGSTIKKAMPPKKRKLILIEDTGLKTFQEPIQQVSMPNAIGPNAIGPNAIGPNAIGPGRLNEGFMDILSELADIMQRQGEPFKARAYQQAQETVMTYPGDITGVAQLKGLKGIGKTIESKLEEYVTTGTLRILERERLNPLNVLTRIYGVGPKKAKELIDKGITSIADLKEREKENLLNDTQKIGIKYFDAIETRIPRSEIDEYKKVLEKTFATSTPPGSSFEIVGSYRRGALTSGDIDMIITNKDNDISAYAKFLDQLIKDKVVIEVLTRGKSKSLTIAQLPGKIPRRVDFLYTPPNEYAFALLYFTGSKIFNTIQRQRALHLGYTLNEHGLAHMVSGKKGQSVTSPFPNEKAIFDFLGMKYKEPNERIDGRAVELLQTTAIAGPIAAPIAAPIIAPIIAPIVSPIAAPITIKVKKTTLKKKSETKIDNLSKFKLEGQSALDAMEEKELSKLIRAANEAYYCHSDPIMSDNEYDVLLTYTTAHYPKNKATKEGHTKCLEKVEKNKVTLPYEMWSMDKIKPDTDALDKWKQTYKGPYVISSKLDGVSALYTTENKEPKLYTRGDGLIGQDISHLIPYLHLPTMVGLVIRGEIIIKKQVFLSKYSKEFANPRNFVAGIINKKTPDVEKYKDLSFVAYEVIKPILKPSEQFVLLNQALPLEVARHITLQSNDLTNEYLSELLIKWRAEYIYEIDGIICIDDKIHPRATGNPAHAFAFKMVLSDQVAEAKVVDVIWTPSKDGYLKPRVRIEPITLGGVEIEYATGFNARFIVENNIGVGALIRLIRSGDVIPHITEVIQPASQPLLPTVSYVWNETQVDIMLEDKESDTTVREKTISGFFTNIDVDGLGPGNIKRMISAGYNTVQKIIAMSEADLLTVEGFKTKLAQKIHTNIKQQIEKATLPELMHASNIFGRGFGVKKLKLILEAYPSILTSNETSSEKINNISSVSGMAKKTAEQFVKEIPAFVTFITDAKLQSKLSFQKEEIINQSTINKDHPLYGKKWVMTGFRDKDLIEKLLAIGSEQGTTVNKKTALVIVKDLEEDNSKIEEARKLGIPIMTPKQVMEHYNL